MICIDLHMKSVTDASRKPEQCTEQTVKTSIYKTSPAIFLGNIAEKKKKNFLNMGLYNS